MPLKNEWEVVRQCVITPDGYGKVIDRQSRDKIKIILREPVAGKRTATFESGQIALDTPYTVIRIVNLTGYGYVSSAVNYLTWYEVLAVLQDYPYLQDETLLALNFDTQEGSCNRIWSFEDNYQILSACYDRHAQTKIRHCNTKVLAVELWETHVGMVQGTTGHPEINVLINFEDDEIKILARKILATMQVLKDDQWY